MTYEKITISNEYCLERFNNWEEHEFSHSDMPSFEVLVKMGEALKKQIQLKTVGYCPKCQRKIEFISYHYCPYCGQKIDWSE